MTTSAIYYLGKPFVYPTDSLIGRFLEAGRGWDSFLGLLLPGLVEEEEPVVVEVGSNIGASLMQILAAKPKARVVCFEPSDRFRPYLLRNVRFAGAIDRVEVRPTFLGAASGVSKLYVSASSGSAVSPDQDAHERRQEQSVEVDTLDSELNGGRVDFLKIDTDGFEFEVIRGAEGVLRRWRPPIHFEFATYLIPDPPEGLQWLRELGYERFLCLTPQGRYIGITTDIEQTIAWATENKHGYCDVLTCARGSRPEVLLDSLDLDGTSQTRG